MINEKNIDTSIIPIRLEVLSPVHIGSGEMLSPLNYRIEQENDEYFVHTIDFDAWLDNLTMEEAEEFAKEFSTLNIVEVWQTIKNKVDLKTFSRAKSKCVEEIYKKYLDRLKSGTSSNELSQSTRNPLNSSMLIPGSSIKGAISTAIFDFFITKELRRPDEREFKDLEKKLFSHKSTINNRPYEEKDFQGLKISDFELLPDESQFVVAKEYSQKAGKENSMKGYFETAPISNMHRINKYAMLTLGTFSKSTKSRFENTSFSILAKLCNDFYRKRFDDEMQKFYTKPHFAHAKPFMDRLSQKLDANKDAILLRVGHFSHVESITISKNAPKTRKLKNGTGNFPFGTTRTLADGKYPFGWVLLHQCTMEEYEDGIKKHEEEKTSYAKNLKENLYTYGTKKKEADKEQEEIRKTKEAEFKRMQAEQEEQRRIEEEKELALKAEQAQKEAEKQARKEEAKAKEQEEQNYLDSLSPEEKLFALVIRKKASTEEVLKAFEQIEKCTNKYELAEAIRDAWKKDGKWSGKKVKDSQLQRVKKLEELLKQAK